MPTPGLRATLGKRAGVASGLLGVLCVLAEFYSRPHAHRAHQAWLFDTSYCTASGRMNAPWIP